MNPNQQAAAEALQKSQQAQLKGDKRAARRYAEEAVRLAPEWEDAWLMLAALAEPRASIAYIEQALKINPQSERARQAMHWAINRSRMQSPLRRVLQFAGPLVSPTTPAPRHDRHADPAAVISKRIPFSLIALFALCFFVAFVAWSGGVSPALAQLGIAPTEAPLQIAGQSEVLKPTYTFTPTDTPSATATFTPSPTPTDTATPTDTPTATLPPIPPPTEAPALPVLSDLPIPVLPTQPIASVPNPQPVAGSGGGRWIDVDLTNQMVYAYQGSQMVNSFLVSTGTWQYPTVTGQYNIYIKLRYSDMAGPGYYLPNVPYTMYFYKGYALHGTYWHSNFGTPMSHGCVNLSIPDSEWLYNFADVGTLVNVHY